MDQSLSSVPSITQVQGVSRDKMTKSIREAFRLALHHSAQGLMGYLHHVAIDSRPEPMSYRLIAEDWQWFLMEQIAPAIEAVCGLRKDYSGPRRFLFVLGRGHDKTSCIGRILNWALGFAKRKVSCIAAAGDRDQASRLADFMKTESGLNPWLNELVDHHNYIVRGQRDSKLQIISADANSSFGDKSDIVICDELTHWPNEDLWSALYSGSEKRPDSVYIIITNAGLLGSWQHELMLMARRKPEDWFVFEAPGPISKYMDPKRTEELAASLPKGVADRVIRNKWLDPAEGAGYLTRQEAQIMFDLGEEFGLMYQGSGTASYEYVASIDYGSTKDRTVLTVGHLEDRTSKLGVHKDCAHVDRMDVWQGSATNRVKIDDVNAWIEDIEQKFHHPLFVVDPHQMEGTIQKYEAAGYRLERFEPRGGKSNYELAISLHNHLTQKKLAAYPDCGTILIPQKGIAIANKAHTVVDELAELVLKITTYGFRFDHESSKHDDRAVGLGMLTIGLTRLPKRRKVDWDDPRFF